VGKELRYVWICGDGMGKKLMGAGIMYMGGVKVRVAGRADCSAPSVGGEYGAFTVFYDRPHSRSRVPFHIRFPSATSSV
jgi:hypothetical protein